MECTENARRFDFSITEEVEIIPRSFLNAWVKSYAIFYWMLYPHVTYIEAFTHVSFCGTAEVKWSGRGTGIRSSIVLDLCKVSVLDFRFDGRIEGLWFPCSAKTRNLTTTLLPSRNKYNIYR